MVPQHFLLEIYNLVSSTMADRGYDMTWFEDWKYAHIRAEKLKLQRILVDKENKEQSSS